MNDKDQQRDAAQVQVAVMREVLIARVLDVLAARTHEQLHAAGLATGGTDLRNVEHANNTLEWAAAIFVAALNDPALEEKGDD